MSTFDRRPPNSRSPFETLGQGGKLMRPAEKVEPDHVRGCGVPSCPICMPKGGRGGAQGGRVNTASSARSSGFEGFPRAIMEELARQIAASPVEMVFELGRDGDVRTASSITIDPSAAAKRAEKEARKPVEKYLLRTSLQVAWDDVVGNETARQHLVEAIEDPIRHRELYAHYGKKATKGVLLFGPPGCGKTMFGKAAASVLAQIHGRKDGEPVLLSLKGPEIQSPYVGVTEEIIRQVFAYARAYQDLHGHPLVIFIDEADAILPSRDGSGGRRALQWEESNVATFLTEMDGLETSGALVILATNRPESIDAAILRDGRIDRKVKVERPDRAAAETIIAKALAGVPVARMVRETVTVSAGGETLSSIMFREPPTPLDEADTRRFLARAAADAVFSVEQVVAPLATDQGSAALRLSDIVNGAMLVGIVEQAKGNAFRRDLAQGGRPTGLTRADFELAVHAVVEQNRGLNHVHAVIEKGQREGFRVAQPLPMPPPGAASPRYTLDAEGEVVPVQ